MIRVSMMAALTVCFAAVALAEPSATQPRTVFDQATAKTQEKLDQRLPELRFEAIPLGDVIDFLRDSVNINIFIDRQLLLAAHVDLEGNSSLALRNARLSTVLSKTFEAVSPKDSVVVVQAVGKLAIVSTKEAIPALAKLMTNDAAIAAQVPKIDEKLISPKFDNVPLKDCLEFLADSSGNRLNVDWAAVKTAGLNDRPVSINAEDLTFIEAARLMLRLAAPQREIVWTLDGTSGTVMLSVKPL